MKKFFTPTLIALLAAMPILAQTLVTTAIQPRNAVLEEFTGVNCVNCPDGHLRANQLYNAFPGRVVLINIHSGSFANPSSGQPDFRTPWGNPIDAFAGVAAYPSGTMNRVVWAGAYNAPLIFHKILQIILQSAARVGGIPPIRIKGPEHISFLMGEILLLT